MKEIRFIQVAGLQKALQESGLAPVNPSDYFVYSEQDQVERFDEKGNSYWKEVFVDYIPYESANGQFSKSVEQLGLGQEMLEVVPSVMVEEEEIFG